jgi:hypothetical protein
MQARMTRTLPSSLLKSSGMTVRRCSPSVMGAPAAAMCQFHWNGDEWPIRGINTPEFVGGTGSCNTGPSGRIIRKGTDRTACAAFCSEGSTPKSENPARNPHIGRTGRRRPMERRGGMVSYGRGLHPRRRGRKNLAHDLPKVIKIVCARSVRYSQPRPARVTHDPARRPRSRLGPPCARRSRAWCFPSAQNRLL